VPALTGQGRRQGFRAAMASSMVSAAWRGHFLKRRIFPSEPSDGVCPTVFGIQRRSFSPLSADIASVAFPMLETK